MLQYIAKLVDGLEKVKKNTTNEEGKDELIKEIEIMLALCQNFSLKPQDRVPALLEICTKEELIKNIYAVCDEINEQLK